jgi:hypothetical protein
MRLTHYTQMQNCQENPRWELESDQEPLSIAQSFATIGQAVTVEKVRREKALDFSECNSRPGTGSLHPVDRLRRSIPDHGWR